MPLNGFTGVTTPALKIARAAIGPYSPDMLEYGSVDVGELQEGEVLVRIVYLSLDPSNRNWMRLEPGTTPSINGVPLKLRAGAPMWGQTLGQVEESRSPDLSVDDLVAGLTPWQERFRARADTLRQIVLKTGEPLAAHLTLFSHVGLAAWKGMTILDPQPGETLVVTGAAGATGSVAVEIAKARGARVIGIAGGPGKCAAVQGLGADAVIDYKAESVEDALSRAAPDGVDAVFDNVGGVVLEGTLPSMNMYGRVAICGVMAEYDMPFEQQVGIRNMYFVLIRQLRIQGFLAGFTDQEWIDHLAALHDLFDRGLIHSRPHVVRGFDRSPEYLALLFSGGNTGKLIVQVSPEPVQSDKPPRSTTPAGADVPAFTLIEETS